MTKQQATIVKVKKQLILIFYRVLLINSTTFPSKSNKKTKCPNNNIKMANLSFYTNLNPFR